MRKNWPSFHLAPTHACKPVQKAKTDDVLGNSETNWAIAAGSLQFCVTFRSSLSSADDGGVGLDTYRRQQPNINMQTWSTSVVHLIRPLTDEKFIPPCLASANSPTEPEAEDKIGKMNVASQHRGQ